MADLEKGWDKAQIKGRLEDGETYKYYAIADYNPVRVTLSPRGFGIGAESIDLATGQLARDNMLLGRILTSYEVEEIDKIRFEKLCKALINEQSQKKNNKPGISWFS